MSNSRAKKELFRGLKKEFLAQGFPFRDLFLDVFEMETPNEIKNSVSEEVFKLPDGKQDVNNLFGHRVSIIYGLGTKERGNSPALTSHCKHPLRDEEDMCVLLPSRKREQFYFFRFYPMAILMNDTPFSLTAQDIKPYSEVSDKLSYNKDR